MTFSADLASLRQRLATLEKPILPSGEHRGILGCGYVGQAVAQAWKDEGHEITATTTTSEKLNEMAKYISNPCLFEAGTSRDQLGFVQDLDGILVSIAPTRSSKSGVELYQDVFFEGIKDLSKEIQNRQTTRPFQLIYLSSCGVYGDQGGALTNEATELSSPHPVNQVLIEAEERVRSLQSANVKVCILRLGGIYGPVRDIPSMLLSAAGSLIQRNGLNVPCWIHRDDIVKGINFAFSQNLSGTFNLVNDTQLSGQELTDRLCEQAGLPLAKWLTINTNDRVLNARVCNSKIKELGFSFSRPCLLN